MKKLTEVISKTGTDKIVIAGGVAANKHLRERLEAFGKRNGISIYMPERQYCGDNGAMVASQAYFEYRIGNLAGTDLNAIPS